jgi:hypothetical protein
LGPQFEGNLFGLFKRDSLAEEIPGTNAESMSSLGGRVKTYNFEL